MNYFTLALVATVPAYYIPFENDFKDICQHRWLDRAAQIKCESNFDPNIKSFDNGEGLGQATNIWPWYIKMGWVHADSNPYQVRPAIQGAHKYMVWLEARVKNHYWLTACGAYNAGLGSIQKAQKLADIADLPGDEAWLTTLPQVTKANSRYTINYIKHLKQVRSIYRKHYES